MAQTTKGPLLSDRTAEEATRPLINCCIAFIVLNTVFVAGRAFSRHSVAKLSFWWDDFWIYPAYICFLGLAGLGIGMSRVEVYYDNEDRIILGLDELSVLLKSIYAFIQLLLPAYAATRFSILALYLRIFSGKRIRRACWFAVAFITLQYFAFAFAAVFMCRPVQFFWNKALPGGSCFNIDGYYRSITIPNIIMDIYIVVLPIPTVWRLKSSGMRKWALTLVFCIGVIALVASCIRLWVFETHTGELLAPQYTNVLIAWLVVEPSIYLIAACLPAMHHVFALMVPKPINDWIDKRMAAMKHPLSDTACNDRASQSSRMGKHAMFGDFTKLTDDDKDGQTTPRDGNKSLVQAERKASLRKNSSNDSDVFEMEQGQLASGGIMVTKEVIVTQEDRIADVIGF